ncbi:MAG: presqualene diphosphate synthase HpnD [Chloroflexi bacterium]|nr:presqualene diphosphate synthase HpnD [Chloroflexota bacterium]MYE40888.1 presqualene diphosphate synthase HpnD [Chloroflexota bacterium]
MATSSAELEFAYADCRNITRREAKNFYYAVVTLPPDKRKAVYAAYAFCRQCDDSVDEAASPEAKLSALTDLQVNLALAYEGRPATPVFLALADTADRYDIPQEYFSEIIRGVESDLVKTRYQDFDELREYCYRVASVVGLVCLQIFEYRDPAARDYAVDLGLAMQLTNIVRDVREDWSMGRVYLPQDEMARFGYTEEQLGAGIHNDAFVELLRFQGQRARSYFRSGFRLLPYLSRRSRACPAALGAIYSRVLDRIEASGYDVLGEQRIALSGSEKARIAARAWMASMLSLPGSSS